MKEGHFQDGKILEFTSEDIRFTAKADVIYAIVMKWPEDGVVRIRSLGVNAKFLYSSIRNIEILGQDNCPLYEYREDWLEVTTGLYEQTKPVVLKITID